MAKTIKFNLICDNKPVRTLEDLQHHFSIEDVLLYYNNKLLHRWLEVRGYTEELEKINGIVSKNPIEIIKKLIKIFNVLQDSDKVEESIYMLKYTADRQQAVIGYNKENYKLKTIVKDYEMGYKQLVKGILDNPSNVSKIKANIAEIVTNYAWVLDLDHRNLFYVLKDKSVLAIMCLLMNPQSRKYYLPIAPDKEDSLMLENDPNDDKAQMFIHICSMITASNFKTMLNGNLITFSGVTEGYWKDLEPKGKQCMVISMHSGDFVRPAGVAGGDLVKEDILNKFVIMDGIDYKSNSETHQLWYMEV